MAGGSGENDLNLVPYMDIMVNLIMFMIVATAYIVELREAPVVVPSYGQGGGASSGEEPPPFLTVQVTPTAINIFGSTPAISPRSLPRTGGEYPFAELTASLKAYKANYDVADVLRLAADPKVPYKSVIGAMDAARSEGPVRWDFLKQDWAKYGPRLRAAFEELSAEDIDEASGQQSTFAAMVKERYSCTDEVANKKVMDFLYDQFGLFPRVSLGMMVAE